MKYSLDFWRPFNPTKEFSALQKGINRLFEDAFPAGATQWVPADFQPECDVEETENEYKMSFDLPGMKKEDIKIEVLENRLTVKGERQEEKKEENKNRKVFERRYGRFERTFTLPTAINPNRVEATYDKGVLSLMVSKEGAVLPHHVEVKECHIERAPTKKEIRPQAAPTPTKQAI